MFTFDRMLSSRLILAVYGLGLFLIAGVTTMSLFRALLELDDSFLGALFSLVVTIVVAGTVLLIWRLLCESAILMFGVYDRLGEIRDLLAARGVPATAGAVAASPAPLPRTPPLPAPAPMPEAVAPRTRDPESPTAETLPGVREPAPLGTAPPDSAAPASDVAPAVEEPAPLGTAPPDSATPASDVAPEVPAPKVAARSVPDVASRPPEGVFRPEIGARGITTRMLVPAGFADFGGGRTARVVSQSGDVSPGVLVEVVAHEGAHAVVRPRSD